MVVDGVELRPDGEPVKINLDTYRALAAAGWEVTDDGRKPRVPELIVVENEDLEGIIREPNYELPEEVDDEAEGAVTVEVDGEVDAEDVVEAEAEVEVEAEADVEAEVLADVEESAEAETEGAEVDE